MAARSTTSREDLGHLVAVGFLIGGVLVVLLLGAILRNPAADAADEAAVAAPEPSSSAPAAPPPADPPVAAVGLTDRVAADLDRIARVEGAWTAQLAVLCEAERAQGLLDTHGHRSGLYLLPAMHEGKACVRACWGSYRGADEARTAKDLPRLLRRLQATPMPKRIDEVTR